MAAYPALIIVGHAMSAMAYAALAIWRLRAMRGRGASSKVEVAFIAALLATALWSIANVAAPTGPPFTSAAETVRNGAWLSFMLLFPQAFTTPKPISAASYVYSALFTVIALQLLLLLLRPDGVGGAALDIAAYDRLSDLLNMIFAIGALMLVHDLYRSFERDSRWGISLPLAGLAAMWCYDLNLYTISYLGVATAAQLEAMRGFGATILLILFAFGTRRNSRMQIRLSRSAAFQSASLLAIGLYLAVMLMSVWAIAALGGPNGDAYALGTLFAMSLAGLLIMPSDRFRAWMRVMMEKHFFRHRYDYRDEWMRFTETIGRTDNEMGPIGHRVLKAVCDICQSPGALLLMPDNIGHFRIAGRWDWAPPDPKGELLSRAAAQTFEQRNFILDLENARRGIGSSAGFPVPGWAMAEPRAWIFVPFVHLGRLVGVAVLQRPRAVRPLDWEDFDMLRIASAQAASYLAEAQGRESLAEVQRFEEFNRRFAFIMHDIKNLVSQLSLLARNAERHADNPEFRTDMVETLRSSVGKMNDLLARLSQHHRGRAESVRHCDLNAICDRAAGEYGARHPITLVAPTPVAGMADPGRVATIVGHLLQNAIDASDKGAPIYLELQEKGGMAAISVIDCGKGISEEFLRGKLFKPFNSDKQGGFGIGAYEAQMLARAMGGRIDVESQPGVGSRFTVLLPLAVGAIDGKADGKEHAA